MAAKLLTSVVGTDQPRRRVVTLTASDATLPVPSWAQGGKGIVYVTGVGAGAGGKGGSNTDGTTSHAGGAGAWAMDLPLIIPSGVATLNCQIGTKGTGGAFATEGTAGGATTITGSALMLTLGGGLASVPTTASPNGGVPLIGTATGAYNSNTSTMALTGAHLPQSQGFRCGRGASGGTASGNLEFATVRAGGPSPLGNPGINGTAGNPGGNASGYGAGGGAGWSAAGAGTIGGDGADGVLILTFVEGL